MKKSIKSADQENRLLECKVVIKQQELIDLLPKCKVLIEKLVHPSLPEAIKKTASPVAKAKKPKKGELKIRMPLLARSQSQTKNAGKSQETQPARSQKRPAINETTPAVLAKKPKSDLNLSADSEVNQPKQKHLVTQKAVEHAIAKALQAISDPAAASANVLEEWMKSAIENEKKLLPKVVIKRGEQEKLSTMLAIDDERDKATDASLKSQDSQAVASNELTLVNPERIAPQLKGYADSHETPVVQPIFDKALKRVKFVTSTPRQAPVLSVEEGMKNLFGDSTIVDADKTIEDEDKTIEPPTEEEQTEE